MSKAKVRKAKVIDSLEKDFAKSTIGILTDYRGLTGPEMTALRRRLRDAKIEYKVVKNTMARFAGERVGVTEIDNLLKGPVAVALGTGDVAEPARVLTDYIRTTRSILTIKGGFLGGKVLTPADITAITELPPRPVLIARVLGGMQAPITAFMYVLNASLQNFTGVLQARINQLEGVAK
jgi:large subunit ribosomal protein L10